MPAPQICVVAPMHNEAGNAARLAAEVYDVLRDIPHEIVFVNDASTDSTLDELVAAKADIPSLRVISHRSNAGHGGIEPDQRRGNAPLLQDEAEQRQAEANRTADG